jgi:hypothetical protein
MPLLSRYPHTQFVGSPGDNRIYNDHCSAPFSRAFLVGFSTTKVYSGVGADMVMESFALIMPVAEHASAPDSATLINGLFRWHDGEFWSEMAHRHIF